MAVKKKTVKKKGPKGKKARAKAKLDRQWGETAIVDDENQTRRVGKSRLLAKKQTDKSRAVTFGDEIMEPAPPTQSNAPSGILRNKPKQRRQHDDDGFFSDSSHDDSDAEAAPLSNLLNSIKSIKRKQKRKQRDVPFSASEQMTEAVEEDEEVSDAPDMEDSDVDSEDDSDMEGDDAVEEDADVDDEDSVANANENAIDLFWERFSREPLKDSELSAAVPSNIKLPTDGSNEIHISKLAKGDDLNEFVTADGKEKTKSMEQWHNLAESSFEGNRKLLQRQWRRANGKRVLSDSQAPLYSFLSRYSDILATTQSRKHRKEMHRMYLLHVLNHVLTSRSRIQRHNRDLKEKEEAEADDNPSESKMDDKDERFRDQGFTRPSVLVLLPTRGLCHRFVKDLIKLVGSDVEKAHMDRFEADYGNVVDEDDEGPLEEKQERRRKAILEKKGKEWNEMFGDEANQDDDFKMGIALTPKAAKTKKDAKSTSTQVKLYTDFFKSDIIVASPLGLKLLISPDGETGEMNCDYLSSIEICLLEYADVLMMQNWDHVNDVLSLLNSEPQSNNNTDFSRVRNYLLEGQGANWRQLIISGSITDPFLMSTFKRFGQSISGSIRTYRKVAPEDAALASVLVPMKQVFQKVPVASFAKQSDGRVEYFVKNILPQILRYKQKQTMIYVPSYFDFVALRNIFLKRELSFVSVTEYSRITEVGRGRARFLQGRKPIMLFTGRCNFFHRHMIKGVRHLVFLGLPEHPTFYSEQVNLIDTTPPEDLDIASSGAPAVSCLTLFTQYEAHALERIVGTGNCSSMLQSSKASFMFHS